MPALVFAQTMRFRGMEAKSLEATAEYGRITALDR